MMKTKLTLLIIAGTLLCLYACKKESNSFSQSTIIGRWYETKLAIQQQTLSNGAIANATYTAKDFDTTYYW